MMQRIKERDIARERIIETSEIERRKAVELAEQERAIAIASKSKAQSEAQSEADRARALAVQAEEQVATMRAREQAERQKAIELVKASEEAERAAIKVRTEAAAEKQASEDRAEAARLAARGAADAELVSAEAAARRYEVDAAGKRALHEASNALSVEQIGLQVKLAALQALPEIIRQSVRPMKNIDGIKILQVDGLTPGSARGVAGAGADSATPSNGNLAEDMVRSALRYRAHAPIVDALLGEIGIRDGLGGALTGSLEGAALQSGSLEPPQRMDSQRSAASHYAE
jgi:uncharacterized membrane protein YqiK